MERLKNYNKQMAFSIYEKIALNPIYEQHLKHIDAELHALFFLPAEVQVILLEELMNFYNEDLIGNLDLPITLSENSSASFRRSILVINVCKYIEKKIVDIKKQSEVEFQSRKLSGRPKKGNYTRSLQDELVNFPDLYSRLLDFLSAPSHHIDGPFVEITAEGPKWQKTPVHGWQQYVAAFFYLCLKFKIIGDLSSTDLQQLIFNSFQVKPGTSQLKSLRANIPKEKYLRPFETFFNSNLSGLQS